MLTAIIVFAVILAFVGSYWLLLLRSSNKYKLPPRKPEPRQDDPDWKEDDEW